MGTLSIFSGGGPREAETNFSFFSYSVEQANACASSVKKCQHPSKNVKTNVDFFSTIFLAGHQKVFQQVSTLFDNFHDGTSFPTPLGGPAKLAGKSLKFPTRRAQCLRSPYGGTEYKSPQGLEIRKITTPPARVGPPPPKNYKMVIATVVRPLWQPPPSKAKTAHSIPGFFGYATKSRGLLGDDKRDEPPLWHLLRPVLSGFRWLKLA